MERKIIKSKRGRILYFPLALIQWIIYTFIFSFVGGIIVEFMGIVSLIQILFTLDKEELEFTLTMMKMPFTTPIEWWKDYITKGEIGPYE